LAGHWWEWFDDSTKKESLDFSFSQTGELVFSGLTETEVQRFLLGTIIKPFPPMASQEQEVLRDFITLPTSFNAVD
jgi:hypothetical protein